MKKTLVQFLFLLSIALVIFSCKKSDDEPGPGWTDEDKSSYQQVINVQDEIGNNLDDWFQSMDSLDAINQAYEAFISDENVSSATINDQGIAVQYANGIRGGLFLNPRDEDLDKKSQLIVNPLGDENSSNLKSLVNQRKMILINPHYYQRSSLTDQIYTISRSNLQRAGINLATFYKNEEATVDRFTELSGYGIIQIYSHGWAWPKKENITDIYLLTGETANEATSKKYWDDLKVGNIPIMKIGPHNKYFISQEFVSNYNDFSNDTVMFYGGFCFSFLGGWPDIIDNFADGAYMGFDWSVLTFFNANMSVNSMALMSDTSKTSPMNLEAWMNDPGVEKSFWHSLDNRTVYIHYAGDGNLKLWDDVDLSASIQALSSDGAPVAVEGEKDISYPFKCVLSGQTTGNYNYTWDSGEGYTPVTIDGNNQANITWLSEGDFTLSVQVKDATTNVIVTSADIGVTIGGGESILEYLHTLDRVGVGLHPGSAIHLSNGTSPIGTLEFYPDEWNMNASVQWSGNTFSFSGITGGEPVTIQINGILSEDGRTIETVTATRTYPYYQLESEVVFTNLSTSSSSGSETVSFGNPNGQTEQYVNSYEFIRYDGNDEWITIESIDWEDVYTRVIFYKAED
ncbi:MAG: PKD domain-containing protein [Bacteroidetes bacterium]|nr:PKD domain-containing protein [Bacteroidota bacterium]